jgi:serine protease Do
MNMKGEIVAINSLMISKVNENAGLAISIRADVVKHSIKTMLEYGIVDRGALGIMITPLGDERQRDKILKKNPTVDQKHIPNTLGLLISDNETIPEELKLWDTVVAIGGVPINNGIEFAEEMNKYEIGKKVSVTIIRRKRFIQLDLMIKVFEVPVDKMYARPGVVKP